MLNFQKYIAVFLLGCFVLTVLLGCSFSSFNPVDKAINQALGEGVRNLMEYASEDLNYTDLEIAIPEAPLNVANYRQINASVRLFASGGELFFYLGGSDRMSTDTGRLGVFRNGGAQIFTAPPKNLSGITVLDNYAYYCWFNDDLESILYCFDLRTGEISEIANRGFYMSSGEDSLSLGVNETLYFVQDYEESIGFPISGKTIGELEDIPCDFLLGEWTYSTNWTNGGDLVRSNSSLVKETVPLKDGREWFMPCRGGLLAINKTNGNALHFIDEDGTILELYNDNCEYGVLAANCWDDYVFLSIQRYGEHRIPYENDTQSGTYRISLQDHRIEKLSDYVYNGLYIFSDGEIYACDRTSNVHKLDFNGTIVAEIISSH